MNGGSCSNNIFAGTSNIENEIIDSNFSTSSVDNKNFICKCLPEFQGLQCEVYSCQLHKKEENVYSHYATGR